jgi:hypothetical protein
MIVPFAALRRSLRDSRAQALPIAMGALALGAILVTPLLAGASTGSRATTVVGQSALTRYSLDAAIEWSGWRLISNPRLTTVTSWDATPLAPFPASVNGAPFPTTEIRYVANAGNVEAQAPSWQAGGGDKCYAVSVADVGTLSVRITVDSGQVWTALLAGSAPCVRPGGLAPLPGPSPMGADFAVTAGSYQLLVSTDTATTGSISMSVPAATYDVRATSGARTTVARLIAGYAGLQVASWQLN